MKRALTWLWDHVDTIGIGGLWLVAAIDLVVLRKLDEARVWALFATVILTILGWQTWAMRGERKEVHERRKQTDLFVASIVATPVPHRHIGVSIADVVLDIQEIKTQMLRQGVDNLFHANNPRLFLPRRP